jgi:rubrerythrin
VEQSNLTCAAIISFAKEIEDNSAEFYRNLADKYPNSRTKFLSFSKECRKNKTLITRTYQETISDALEACFITGPKLENYAIRRNIPKTLSPKDALEMAIEIEDEAIEAYLSIAEQTKQLLATIPMAFRTVAKNRKHRRQELNRLLDSLG